MSPRSHGMQDLACNRYYDSHFELPAVKVLPGEYYVTAGEELLVTVLGSCVSCCLRDRERPIGGMNHFMLPNPGQHDLASESGRYGVNAMELLINRLLHKGARRQALVAKVFGGGKVLTALDQADVGSANSEFVLEFLAAEGIEISSQDLLGPWPRKVYFFPGDNRVLVKKLKRMHNDTIVRREIDYRQRLRQEPMAGSVELFE